MVQCFAYKSMLPTLTQQIVLKVSVFNVFTLYLLLGNWVKLATYFYIQATKHLLYSISSRAICKLKWCAGILIRQTGSDIVKLICFTCFDGKTQSWD